MWKHYFGKDAKIVGIDINPACKQLEQEGIAIEIGSQEDESFGRRSRKNILALTFSSTTADTP